MTDPYAAVALAELVIKTREVFGEAADTIPIEAVQLARVVLAMAPVIEATIAMREVESTDVPGESIAELEANVPAAQRRTAIALTKWRTAVDQYRKATP